MPSRRTHSGGATNAAEGRAYQKSNDGSARCNDRTDWKRLPGRNMFRSTSMPGEPSRQAGKNIGVGLMAVSFGRLSSSGRPRDAEASRMPGDVNDAAWRVRRARDGGLADGCRPRWGSFVVPSDCLTLDSSDMSIRCPIGVTMPACCITFVRAG